MTDKADYRSSPGNTQKKAFILLSITAFCTSSKDCNKGYAKTVCKETVPGGTKICTEPRPGTPICKENEFASSDNVCEKKDLQKCK